MIRKWIRRRWMGHLARAGACGAGLAPAPVQGPGVVGADLQAAAHRTSPRSSGPLGTLSNSTLARAVSPCATTLNRRCKARRTGYRGPWWRSVGAHHCACALSPLAVPLCCVCVLRRVSWGPEDYSRARG